MKSLLVVGYRHTDLGIFSEKDPRLAVLKEAIRQDLIRFLEEGVEWLIFTGNLGFEYWCLEVAKELKEEGYSCQLATLFLFENHGENWNEVNQVKLAHFRSTDFVKVIYPRYENPSQFRSYNQFLLDNTDGAYIFYDSENETNLKYLYHEMLKKEEYSKKTLTFDRLNEVAENFKEIE
ncbi:DUF1273 domain-containing protein [Streptococcus marmotae]|uniref:DUF1273 domain-containing protein n=1 Tax=Streptococcus marmotae TaxID=1825069 RepID=UPI00082D6883|nr:DUF1273 domain-containing protein [Streptococcus marmotae]